MIPSPVFISIDWLLCCSFTTWFVTLELYINLRLRGHSKINLQVYFFRWFFGFDFLLLVQKLLLGSLLFLFDLLVVFNLISLDILWFIRWYVNKTCRPVVLEIYLKILRCNEFFRFLIDGNLFFLLYHIHGRLFLFALIAFSWQDVSLEFLFRVFSEMIALVLIFKCNWSRIDNLLSLMSVFLHPLKFRLGLRGLSHFATFYLAWCNASLMLEIAATRVFTEISLLPDKFYSAMTVTIHKDIITVDVGFWLI